jgi:hypothetical protein
MVPLRFLVTEKVSAICSPIRPTGRVGSVNEIATVVTIVFMLNRINLGSGMDDNNHILTAELQASSKCLYFRKINLGTNR